MRALMLAAMLATAAPAWGEVPEPDSSASAWLNAIRQRLFDQARNSILFIDCAGNGDVTEARRFTQVFNEEVQKLSDADDPVKGVRPANAAYTSRRASKAGVV